MHLDIRLPIGALFTTLGIVLFVFGFFSNPAIYAQSLGINVNLDWGAVLLTFGILMLYLGGRGLYGPRRQKVGLKNENRGTERN